jgi:sugar lactone lactonase YvrE
MVANTQFLYIADTGNHALRILDRHTGSFKSLRHEGLRQPWDLEQVPEAGGAVFVAMAGNHQLWAWVPETGEIGPLAGSEEGFSDGPSEQAQLSRPSGLALAGRYLFFVDASALRVLDLEQNQLGRLCGQAEAGDQDGKGAAVRLSRPLGITLDGEFLYIADTGNNKIKQISLRSLDVQTITGSLKSPGGLCIIGDFLLIADTQAHQIQALHLKSRVLRPVALQT